MAGHNTFLRLKRGLAAPGLLVRRLSHGSERVPATETPEHSHPGTTGAPRQEQPAAHRAALAGRVRKIGYLKRTYERFDGDDCMNLAAALAYYTTFSLPPLLLIIISVVGLVLGRQAVQHQIQEQIQGLIGQGSGAEIGTMVRSAGQHQGAGVISLVVGVGALIFGATGAVTSLIQALNRVWHVKPDPKLGGVRNFIQKRLLSLGMIIGVGFLLLVSLVVSAAIAAFGGWAGGFLPHSLSGPLLRVLSLAGSWLVIGLLFAAIFKVLPDAKVHWRDVWIGAAITAGLFSAGKAAIGYYLGHSGAAHAYGAAGSLVVIVLWVYYSSLLVLAGAEFTSVWAEGHGRAIRPAQGAVKTSENQEPRAA